MVRRSRNIPSGRLDAVECVWSVVEAVPAMGSYHARSTLCGSTPFSEAMVLSLRGTAGSECHGDACIEGPFEMACKKLRICLFYDAGAESGLTGLSVADGHLCGGFGRQSSMAVST